MNLFNHVDFFYNREDPFSLKWTISTRLKLNCYKNSKKK